MKIEKKDMKDIYNLILKSDLMTIAGKSVLFFPIDSGERVEETSDGIILLEVKKEGSFNLVKPGFISVVTEDIDGKIFTTLELGYVTTEYAVPFDIVEYHEFMKKPKLGRKEIDKLSKYDCFLVRKENVIAEFKY